MSQNDSLFSSLAALTEQTQGGSDDQTVAKGIRALGDQRGGNAEVAEWASNSRGTMLAVAMSRGLDRDAAEDVVQRTLTKAMRVLERDGDALKRIKDPRRWLAAVARNVARDAIRTKQRRNRIQRENTDQIREAICDVTESGWAVESLSGQVLDAGRKVLTSRQAAIVHGILQGMTDEEIGEEFSISLATVRPFWRR